MQKLKEIYEEILIENIVGNEKYLPVNYQITIDNFRKNNLFKINADEQGKTTLSGLLNYLKIMGVKLYSIISNKDIEKIKNGIPVVFKLIGLDIKIQR